MESRSFPTKAVAEETMAGGWGWGGPRQLTASNKPALSGRSFLSFVEKREYLQNNIPIEHFLQFRPLKWDHG